MKKYLLLIVFLFGCGGVKLEQDVSIHSYVNCTYSVSTEVWVNNFTGFPVTLEYLKIVKCKYSEIDSVKQLERLKAEKVVKRVQECYEQGCP